ncbi:hypothetical protein Lser_V15G09466 [Lactuca serriola]
MSTTSPFYQPLSLCPSLPSTARAKSKVYNTNSSLTGTARLLASSFSSRCLRNNWRFLCFKDDKSSLNHNILKTEEDSSPMEPEPESNQPNVNHGWLLNLRRIFRAEAEAKEWTVPWTGKTIVQVMLLWMASFWFVGSWIIPFLAHTSGFRKDALTFRGQAFYSLLTDVAEGIAGIGILHSCLAPFRPLSPNWFKFSLKGNWQLDVALGCLMFPFVNRLSQVNLNLFPMLPPAPVTVSNVERSILARDPVAMAVYAVVVSVCAPVWEEVLFRGFLLPSLTRYMPVWCSVIVTSLAFAFAHFNMHRMLPLVFLGIVMGAVFARSRNLLPSMLLHSLWNAFVFIDLIK